MKKKKLIISIVCAALLLVTLIWLLFRGCSADPFRNGKIYQIGRDSTWSPLDLRGREKAMQGFADDLIQLIGNIQDFQVRIFEVGPNALFDGLNIDRYDGVLSSLTPNVVNRRRYLFSDPFYLIGPVLVTRFDSEASSLEDLSGKIIGVERGALQVFNYQEPPDAVIIPYRTAGEALEELDRQTLDAVILDALRAHVWTEGFYSGRLKVITSPLTTRGIRLVTRNEPEFVAFISKFNEGLKEVKQSGEYDALINKWDLIKTEVEPETVQGHNG